MPAQVESGVYNGEFGLPWHSLGVNHAGRMTAAEVLHEAELDFEVEMRAMYLANGVEVPDRYAVVRTRDSAVLGVLGNRYVPAQNVEVLSFLDELIGAGEAVYDSAWSLRGGKTVAISAELMTRTNIGPGEEMRTFVTAATSHDGNGQITFLVTPVRVVCMNTLAMAIGGAKFMWRRKHTANALSRENLAAARDILGIASDYQKSLERVAREMIDESFSGAEFYRFAKRLLDISDDADISRVAEKRLDNLVHLWASAENLEGIRETRWGALNAVAEFADYAMPYQGEFAEDNRTQSILMGRSADLKSRAYALLSA